jgi:PAS domain S-box-containing protein
LELVLERDRPMLVLQDKGDAPLDGLLAGSLRLDDFLPLAIAITVTLGQVHRRGLVHRDIKPANILVNRETGAVRLTGFGIASRLARERQAPTSPEYIAGTLAYMAPEQTGRMNRSIDSRCDLYALGVTFYEMLTGALPFSASDPMEWVHCHIARQPVAPSARTTDVPEPLSAIVLKLLAKTPEDRYQTAAGIEEDLRRCSSDWNRERAISNFTLGENDIVDRLLIPEKLYGRGQEVEKLLASFERVVRSGTPELVLVSGYSGIGKSSVVNELHKVLLPPRGLFASGKFDQYKRDVPYSTLAQAFQTLIRSLLGKTDVELSAWRRDLIEALGPNGQLVIDLVPDLKLIIGDQPPVAQLPPQDAHRRFQLVIRRLVGVFARPEHPLALFLDDLQWLDMATLDLLKDLLTGSELPYVMLIGAYRDNEVDASHPLKQQLQTIEIGGGKVTEIALTPLEAAELGQLIADTLHCDQARAAPLAELVKGKTGGNPFFAIQFVSSLADEGMLVFDHGAKSWRWDLGRIHAKAYTDNVVDFMVGKLTRLPTETQHALQLLACLGNSANTITLSIAFAEPIERCDAMLWPAVHQELVARLAGAYRFAHDRIQEAAYSLIPEAVRPQTHLGIGRRLATQLSIEQQDEALFDLVNQLNRGAALISHPQEREHLSELNKRAGKRAKSSSAYNSALAYFVIGSALLSEDYWSRRHDLMFELELLRAECEFLTGDMTTSEARLQSLSSRADSTIERASIACLQIDLFTSVAQSSKAIVVGLAYLRHLGIGWSLQPGDDDVQREYDRIWSQLGARSIEDIAKLPLMTDPASLATMDVLTKIAPAAFTLMEANFHALATCWAANLSLERGNSDASCDIYVRLGFIAGDRFKDYNSGSRFGKVGYDLAGQLGQKRFQARTYLLYAHFLVPYSQHIRSARDLLDRGLEAADRTGDLMFVGWYRGLYLIENLLASGDALSEVQREAERGLAFASKARLLHVASMAQSHLGLIRSLRGLTWKFGAFEEHRNSPPIESHHSPFADWLFHIRKVQALFHAGEYASAIEALNHAQTLRASGYLQQVADLHFYGALSHAAVCASSAQAPHFAPLVAYHQQLQVWADQCPVNFESRSVLLKAEIARIENQDSQAMHLYELAIRSARNNGFVHYEAIAHECASAFCRARGFDELADFYLHNARDRYHQWGAAGKVRHLDQHHPQLRQGGRAKDPMGTIDAPLEQLDLSTVIKVSQAVTSDVVLDKLLETVMRTAIEQSGAMRGVLILADKGVPQIVAEANVRGGTTMVRLRGGPLDASTLPESIIHFVLRTRESVIVENGAALGAFSEDPYLGGRKTFSALCLPFVNQGNLIAVLYLENTLTSHVFASARIVVLKLLAAQAAISLENSRLYRDLAEREAKIRRLVDANIIGIYLWDVDGRIVEANDAFLRMLGYERDDLVSDSIYWTDLTPPEWLATDTELVMQLRATGSLRPFEKEYFRKDGGRVPVLMGAAGLDEHARRGVAFVLDLTERKRAEEERERLRKLQSELAHVNRLDVMGQLAATLIHEITQPMAAARNNARAALNFLGKVPPRLEDSREALDCVVGDVDRAGSIIDRVRDQIKKAPPRTDKFDLNEAVSEVVRLASGAINGSAVSVTMRLALTLSRVEGDRVQLQQVLLNLVLNAVEAMSSVDAGTRELLISTEEAQSNCVQITVRDSGIGIDPNHRERVFEAFYTTKSAGVGMGLSISRSIIDAHGGRLWVDANEPRGAAFKFILPISKERK